MSDVEYFSVTCSCGHPLTFILRSGEGTKRRCDCCGASVAAERLSRESTEMLPELFDAIERLRESREELVRTVREELLDNGDSLAELVRADDNYNLTKLDGAD